VVQVSATTAKRPASVSRSELLAAVAPLLELLEHDPADVLSVRVGSRQVTVRTVQRGRTRKVLPGVVLTSVHDVVREPVED
jgi:hypothetical protein